MASGSGGARFAVAVDAQPSMLPADGASLARGIGALTVAGHGKSRVGLRGGACRVCDCDDLAGGVHGRVRKKGGRKGKPAGGGARSRRRDGTEISALPDDVLEIVLARLPLRDLAAARCVCRRWRNLSSTAQFERVRSSERRWSPWLFLFGIARDASAGMHCFDVAGECWSQIRMDALNGRYLFSAVGVGFEIFILGGRSGAPPVPLRTHKGVLVYSPVVSKWRRAAPMLSARIRPVVGTFEMTSHCCSLFSRSEKRDHRRRGQRLKPSSDIYDDPHGLSTRLKLRDVLGDAGFPEITAKECNVDNVAGEKAAKQPRLAVIVVGGYGCWDEPLDSAELYDTYADKWVAVASLPADVGAPCSGVVCGKMFFVYTEANKLIAYDTECGKWVEITMLRPPPHLRDYAPKLLCGMNRLFLLCVSWCERDGAANRRERAVRKLFELDLAARRWVEAARHPDAPMDPNAALAADGGERLYAVEMFKIFGQVLNFVTSCDVSGARPWWSRVARSPTAAAGSADALSCRLKTMVVMHL